MADDQEQLRQHWQELAEQLGLEPIEQTPAPSSKEGLAPSTGPDRLPEVSIEGAEHFARYDGSNPYSAETGRPPSQAAAPDQFVSVSETSGDEKPLAVEKTLPESESSQPAGLARTSEKAQRPRSAREPSRKGASREENSPSSDPHARPSPLRSEETSSVADHGEDWPDEKPEASSEDQHDEPEPAFEEELPSSEGPKEDDDTEDLDTLSDWNVPSWAELIASLYRPER